MGERLLKYFQFVGEKAGLQGKLELAKATNMAVSQAANVPDDIVNLEMFREAVSHIVEETPPNF